MKIRLEKWEKLLRVIKYTFEYRTLFIFISLQYIQRPEVGQIHILTRTHHSVVVHRKNNANKLFLVSCRRQNVLLRIFCCHQISRSSEPQPEIITWIHGQSTAMKNHIFLIVSSISRHYRRQICTKHKSSDDEATKLYTRECVMSDVCVSRLSWWLATCAIVFHLMLPQIYHFVTQHARHGE